MGYTTKEFCRLCNVGRETLRHYEQLGFLHPKINPDNHYRSYDGWDASIIADIKRYQSIGFSLEQIRTILSEYKLADLITSVEERVTIYRDQIQYYQMLCKKSAEELDLLRRIPQLSGRYVNSQIPSLFYIPDQALTHVSFADNTNHAMKHLDFFTPCIRIDRDFAGDETKPDYSGWGLITNKEYSDYFKIGERNAAHNDNTINGNTIYDGIAINGITIPASKTICTVIDAGEKGNITKALFDAFYSYMKQNALAANPTIYAYLLTRTHDSAGGYHRYLYTFCPTQALTD